MLLVGGAEVAAQQPAQVVDVLGEDRLVEAVLGGDGRGLFRGPFLELAGAQVEDRRRAISRLGDLREERRGRSAPQDDQRAEEAHGDGACHGPGADPAGSRGRGAGLVREAGPVGAGL